MILENNQPEIKVSICCVTYNHEKYIRHCLDGFVLQKTNFAFEILVHEDASTDNTASILKEYESKYPHLFRCVYQTENQFTKQNTLVNILFKMAKGKYIALCEGDDYWTDPDKLQKQVDFLETNPQFTIHFTNASKIDNLNRLIKEKIIINQSLPYNLKDYLNQGNPGITCTTLFKNNLNTISFEGFEKYKIGDYALWVKLLNQSTGKAYFSEEVTGAYRIHETGIFSNLPEITKQKLQIDTLVLFYFDTTLINLRETVKDALKKHVDEYLKIVLSKNSKIQFLKEFIKYRIFSSFSLRDAIYLLRQ